MRETCEFRVLEMYAPLLFQPGEGKRLSETVRKIEIETSEPRFDAIGKLQAEIQAKSDRSFFYGWNIRRRYAQSELQSADLFHLTVVSTFEPAGEECGTTYDTSTECPHCHAGASQSSSLILNIKKIPKHKDFCRTIAGENLVSRNVVDLFAKHGITGAVFRPIYPTRSLNAASQDYFQLVVPEIGAEIVAPTIVGVDPFDSDLKGQFRCPYGDLLGLNLLSEATIDFTTIPEADIFLTRKFFGMRRGLLRPEREILISPKLWRLIVSENLKGCKVERAHLSPIASACPEMGFEFKNAGFGIPVRD